MNSWRADIVVPLITLGSSSVMSWLGGPEPASWESSSLSQSWKWVGRQVLWGAHRWALKTHRFRHFALEPFVIPADSADWGALSLPTRQVLPSATRGRDFLREIVWGKRTREPVLLAVRLHGAEQSSISTRCRGTTLQSTACSLCPVTHERFHEDLSTSTLFLAGANSCCVCLNLGNVQGSQILIHLALVCILEVMSWASLGSESTYANPKKGYWDITG